MRIVTVALCCAALLLPAGAATAQTTTASISGQVLDAQSLGVPGVLVTALSPNLQGSRTTVTTATGDYVIGLLPAGTYTIRFTLTGFQTIERTVSLAPMERVPVDVTLGPARLAETVNVVGRAASVLAPSSQAVTNISQDLVSTLPTNRDLSASILLAPAVHPTGPGGYLSIAGAMSYDSLFLINGVEVNENLRGQPNALYIEDAIQQTAVATSGISAEFGRFTGGVVNVVTKSGGNTFSGSLRDTLYNDNWRATVKDFPGDTKVDDVVPTYEYTFGGPLQKDRLWFFTAGRLQKQSTRRALIVTNTPYDFQNNSQRYEGKLTYSATSNQRFEGTYTKINAKQVNGTNPPGLQMDLASLYTAELPQDLVTLNYRGILSPKLFVEARYSARHSSAEGIGSQYTDPINGTLLVDFQHGYRWWSPTFCGVCDPEKRDNDEVFLKGTYFTSSPHEGSHSIAFGYDTFNDKRFVNNHQSGSDYRIYATTSVVRGSAIYPVLIPGNSFIEYDPIVLGSQGTNFRTHGLFVNDTWRLDEQVTFDLGLRFDKNHGTDSAGHLVAKDGAWSPRLGVVWNPDGSGAWTVSASASRYVAAINNGIANAASAAGNPTGIVKLYTGPAINPDPTAPTLTDSGTAVQSVFDYLNGLGGFLNAPLPIIFAQVPGLSITVPASGLTSPNVLEYAAGVGRQYGSRSAWRADLTYRNFRDFYVDRVDNPAAVVTDQFGNRIDPGVLGNTNDLKRRYVGLTLTATHRFGTRTDAGGAYTLSRLWGNFDGENFNSGPLASDAFSYPEYRQMSWYDPTGDLSADQRHRASLWLNYGVPHVEGLTISLLQQLASGTPYGAVGQVDARPYVTPAPGYATPQGGPTETYYFTARDAFRTAAYKRTDLAANYSVDVHGASHVWQLFVQAQVINLFDTADLCGCGADVFSNGGPVNSLTIGQTVLTGSTSKTLQPFNPFTTTPVEGVNWEKSSNFGQPLSRFAYTSPRSFHLSFGLRF